MPLGTARVGVRPGEARGAPTPAGPQGPRSPQKHKKEDFGQVEGHLHAEARLVEDSDGLWGQEGPEGPRLGRDPKYPWRSRPPTVQPYPPALQAGSQEAGAGKGRGTDGDGGEGNRGGEASPSSLLKTDSRRNMKAPQVAAKKPLQ